MEKYFNQPEPATDWEFSGHYFKLKFPPALSTLNSTLG